MEERWSKYVGRIVVVSLSAEGAKRREVLIPRLEEWGIRMRTIIHGTQRLMEAQEGSLRVRMGELGCAVAHREAVELAATDAAETVLVFEDDVEAFPGGLVRAGQVLKALQGREDWEVCNLGGCAADWRPGTPAFGSGPHIAGVTRTVRGMVSTHAVVYHRRVYEKILANVPRRGVARGYYAALVKPRAYDEWLHQNTRAVAPIEPCFFQTGEESAILACGRHVIDVRGAIEAAGERMRLAEESEGRLTMGGGHHGSGR